MKQKCKNWLLPNIIPSSKRTGALGKYLASLAKHIQQDVNGGETDGTAACKPSVSRKKLHVLYLLNDLLHHAKYHSHNASHFSTFNSSLQPFLIDIIHSTAINCRSKIHDRLLELLRIWREEEYYSADFIVELKAALDPVRDTGTSEALSRDLRAPERAKDAKELPFVMPSTHGDPFMSYFDLPAGNLMPHIMPNSSAAIRPDQVRALQFIPGPADDGLVHALQDFLKEVDNINDSAQADLSAMVTDIDELGQISYQDENGNLVGGDTYYGWSRAFCEKMKKRKAGDSGRETRTRSYSSSRSRSRSRSRMPRKRRRYSNSTSSRSASRSRSRRSRDGRRDGPITQPSSHGYRKQSRSRSFSPNPPLPLPAPPLAQTNSQPREGFSSQYSSATITQNSPPPFHMLSNQVPFQPPLGPGGLPLPPPPLPLNYSGPWPLSINVPPGLPFPALPLHQGSTVPPRPGPPGPSQNWSRAKWQGNS